MVGDVLLLLVQTHLNRRAADQEGGALKSQKLGVGDLTRIVADPPK